MPNLFLRPARYGTAEVAEILDVEMWRVKNFALPTYGLEPTVKAAGRGSRRYYGFDAVLRLAVANELYRAFLSAEAIKAAIEAVDEHKAIQKWAAAAGRERTASVVLFLSERRAKAPESGDQQEPQWERIWRVLDSERAEKETAGMRERGLAAVSIDLAALWDSVAKRITELEGEGRL